MVNKQLLNPGSIVVVGASNDIHKPGGKVLKNLIDGAFKGGLYAVNPKESEVQGLRSYLSVDDLPDVDLAIIAITAKYIEEAVQVLAENKNTKAFIILSAGFSEESPEGKILEDRIVKIVNDHEGALIGPNCIGVMTPAYHGVFTLPIPKLDSRGCDFISGSGATACFILESGIPKGLTFNSVYSVGNSAQMGVEEILEYMDREFDPDVSPRVKLLYIENISKPKLLLKHASSLIRKGCRIAAVKAGSSEEGSRAASSHTGALATSDTAVDALFRKAGIVRCYGREDLISVASVFMHKPLSGKNIAIITHAGGPAVMLTDALSHGGLKVPHISGKKSQELLTKLYPGSSVANPIDFLATGTAEQLGTIIDYTDNYFDDIDAMAVIFGTPGLTEIFDVYDVLHHKMATCTKPIYPVLPSTLTAQREVAFFLGKGHVMFPDEVTLGNALSRVYHSPHPVDEMPVFPDMINADIRAIIDGHGDGYLPAGVVEKLLDACGIPRAKEMLADTPDEVRMAVEELGFPLVCKVVGPLHKSDLGGVVLNINSMENALQAFEQLMKIQGAQKVLIQPMISGIEMFAGVKKESAYGHLIVCGLGGVHIEVLQDIAIGLAPLSPGETESMLRSLRGYKIMEGVRGRPGIDKEKFKDVVRRLGALVSVAPEIAELDLNPVLCGPNHATVVDVRIRIEKN